MGFKTALNSLVTPTITNPQMSGIPDLLKNDIIINEEIPEILIPRGLPEMNFEPRLLNQPYGFDGQTDLLSPEIKASNTRENKRKGKAKMKMSELPDMKYDSTNPFEITSNGQVKRKEIKKVNELDALKLSITNGVEGSSKDLQNNDRRDRRRRSTDRERNERKERKERREKRERKQKSEQLRIQRNEDAQKDQVALEAEEQAIREKEDQGRVDKEKRERRERKRLAKIKHEKAKAERKRIEQERLEQERLELERLERERIERERLERERIEREIIERERVERERLEQERLEQERLDRQRIKRERRERRKRQRQREIESARLEELRIQQERLEAERITLERLELQRQEEERDSRRRERRRLRERQQQINELPSYKPTLHKDLDLLSFDSRFKPVIRFNNTITNDDLPKLMNQFNELAAFPHNINLSELNIIDDQYFDDIIPDLLDEDNPPPFSRGGSRIIRDRTSRINDNLILHDINNYQHSDQLLVHGVQYNSRIQLPNVS